MLIVVHSSDHQVPCSLLYWWADTNLMSFSVCWTNCRGTFVCGLFYYDARHLAEGELDDTCVITASVDCAWTSVYRIKGLEEWVQGSDSCLGTSSRCHRASSDDRRHGGTDPESPISRSEEVRRRAVCIAYFYLFLLICLYSQWDCLDVAVSVNSSSRSWLEAGL